MNSCSVCGRPIPEGQSICSMCYGDIEYGNDGYYRREMENEFERQMETQRQEAENRCED